MQLIDIENLVLGNIGRYGTVDTGILTLAKSNVNLAIREIVSGVQIPSVVKTQAITTVNRSGTNNPSYDLPADFDIELAVRYLDANGGEWDLTPVSAQDIRIRLGGDLLEEGRPGVYRVRGADSGNLIQMDFHPITIYAGEIISVEYIPLLAALAADSDENIVTIKYPHVVVEIATGWSFCNIIQDMQKGASWLTTGRSRFKNLQSRELHTPADTKDRLPPIRLIAQRRARKTQ